MLAGVEVCSILYCHLVGHQTERGEGGEREKERERKREGGEGEEERERKREREKERKKYKWVILFPLYILHGHVMLTVYSTVYTCIVHLIFR